MLPEECRGSYVLPLVTGGEGEALGVDAGALVPVTSAPLGDAGSRRGHARRTGRSQIPLLNSHFSFPL